MKRCPSCNRTYTDISLNFCLEDGTPLISDAPPAFDPHATIRYTEPPSTTPPPPETYRQEGALLNQVPEMAQPRQPPPQWATAPHPQPAKKSNAVWWILGGVLVVGIIGVGVIIMILVLANIGSQNANTANTNSRIGNRNANSTSNINSGTSLPRSLSDDFATQRWRTGNFQYGDIWYAGDEYHMRAKEQSYLVMYAPSDVYNTENATVRVTARSVDGSGPVTGYGLIIHGQKSPTNELEDYALLIFTGNEPQYEVVMHKANNQVTLVPWAKTSALFSGSSPNQLEVRIRGDQISFYANGRYLTRITDTQNYRRGVVGLYTSDTSEVAFDNLEIER